MTSKPTGTVTFLFTDIENSTRLAREHPETWEVTRARHHTILREAIESHNGFIFQIIGDGFCTAFHRAGDALRAAIKAQHDLQNEPWDGVTIYVRMGIHTGEAENEGNDYRGYTTLSFVQRLMSAGHGGQILLSSTTENLLREQLPEHITLRSMGSQKFAGMPSPVRVFQVIAPDLPTEFPPLRTVDNLPNNLPTQLTSFVGREKELADVRRLLQNTHLLTLIGPGGTGKTRLSLEAASEVLDQYPDGVWFVELAPILDPSLVARATATAIGLRDESHRPVIDMLCDYLREKKLLIVLDNCEHLVDACAQMADRILRAAPDTRILASSREALGIGGEVTYRVPSLGLPDLAQLPPLESLSQYEAVKLFIDRATSAVPTFTVTNENAPALAQICHRLDGIPLAIELAAAKVRVLSVEQIARRIDDRFRLLTGGSRTVLERHQTLRAAIDWSYNLLSPPEQVLFQTLSVFVGGWTLEAAEAVCAGEQIQSAGVLELLEQLINKSLVLMETTRVETRYSMLETMRQYANEKLVEAAESQRVRDSHLEYFLRLAETAEPHLIRPEQLEWLAKLDADYENLRLALKWALGQDSAEPSLRLCAALGWYWWVRYYWLEGIRFLTDALNKPSRQITTEKIFRVRALNHVAALAEALDDLEQMKRAVEQSLELAQEASDKRDTAIARLYAASALASSNDHRRALSLMEQSLKDFQDLNDLYWESYTYRCLGNTRATHDRIELDAQADHELQLARRAGERRNIAETLLNRAAQLLHFSRIEEARKFAEEGKVLLNQMGINSPHSYDISVDIAWLQGNYKEARILLLELRERAYAVGDRNAVARIISDLGTIALEEGELEQARMHLQKALAIAREGENKSSIAGRLAELGNVSYTERNIQEFKQHYGESILLAKGLEILRKRYVLAFLLYSLYTQKLEKVVRILGALKRSEEETTRPVHPLWKRYYHRAEAYARQMLGAQEFQMAFAEGGKLSLDEALDLALNSIGEITEIKLPDRVENTSPAILPSQREAEKQKYGGLTTREREVAAQIAQGKSNQAIAAALFVGLKTVEAHVTRILSKLGFTSRAQIAAWAVAKGLAEAPRDLDTLGRD